MPLQPKQTREAALKGHPPPSLARLFATKPPISIQDRTAAWRWPCMSNAARASQIGARFRPDHDATMNTLTRGSTPLFNSKIGRGSKRVRVLRTTGAVQGLRDEDVQTALRC